MRKKKIEHFIAEIVAVLFSFIILIPLWMILINSFKNSKEANKLGLGFSGDQSQADSR